MGQAKLRKTEIAQLKAITTTSSAHQLKLGRVVITPGAARAAMAHEINLQILLARHKNNDWGNQVEEDKEANEEALIDGGTIYSFYIEAGQRFYIITEWDRSITTVLLPSEY